MFGASALPKHNDISSVCYDHFTAPNYHTLVDNPILYARPDTATIELNGTKVLVALYAAGNTTPYAPRLAKTLKAQLENQAKYLGGKLPVDRYAFLFYHQISPPGNWMFDGLEHSRSTLCLMASPKLDDLDQFALDVASHEFFHIITPLGIHSREVQDYDYRNPKMSRHLWLYEGGTEYATIHMPVKVGSQPLEAFGQTIQRKIAESQGFDTTQSLTAMSIQAMQRQDQYMNFYRKGCLVNLLLDIRLRELSAGQMGTQELMQKLFATYGPDRPFEDAELFDVITHLTYPEIRTFFADYMEGTKPLPLQDYLTRAGYVYDPKTRTVALNYNPTQTQLDLRKAWAGK